MADFYAVRITKQAQEQLREIIRYISVQLQVSETALHLLDLLEEEISSLSQFPYRFALTGEEPWHNLGIHKMSVKNYLVYFWIEEAAKTVHVTAIVYGRRDQVSVLSKMNLTN